MPTKVDTYYARMKKWKAEAAALREILVACDLGEVIKWGKPCYASGGKNVAIVQPMKDALFLMFFKGALLKDGDGVLEPPGENSRAARRIGFTSVAEVTKRKSLLKKYLKEAVAIEEAGLRVEPTDALVLVDELQRALDDDAELKAAFERLTPGRQRHYNLYIGDAKQSSTREKRIEKTRLKILSGKGLRD